MVLQLYLSRLKSDFYAVKSKVGLPNTQVWISYEIMVQVVPLVANYGSSLRSDFYAVKSKVGQTNEQVWISYKIGTSGGPGG